MEATKEKPAFTPGPIYPATAIGDKLREVLAKVEGGEG